MAVIGLIGKKIGMTQVFDEKGDVHPITVLQAGPCVVTQLKTAAKDGYDAAQYLFFIVGNGIGPATCAPVRLAVSTISPVDVSSTR